MNQNTPPLLGVVAVSEAARGDMTAAALCRQAARVSGMQPEHWWLDDDRRVAFYAPELRVECTRSGACAVLAVRGRMAGTGRREPPSAWPTLQPDNGATGLLYDLLERGARALPDIRGQFSLALWDGRLGQLYLARDHLGQRSLFVRHARGLLWFCSELGPLLALDGHPVELDREGAFWYLAFGVAAPGGTLARNIRRLPAAHHLLWRPGAQPTLHRYWTPLHADAPRTADDQAIERIRAAIDHAVTAQLARARPALGLSLSGGVDSTYLAGATLASTGVRPRAYTVEFESGHGMNETPYARAVAQWLGLEHTVVHVDHRAGLAILEHVVLRSPEPCAAWAAISHHALLDAATQHGVTTLLSGLGADEIFGGYDHFRGYYARFLRHAQRHFDDDHERAFAHLLHSDEQSCRRVLYPGVARFFDDTALRRGLLPPYDRWHYATHLKAFYRECLALKPDAQVMEMMVAHECQQRIPDVLFPSFEPLARAMAVDMSYPFLDPDLIQLAAGLEVESRYRTQDGRFSLRLRDLQRQYKYAMMQVTQGRIPDEIRMRPRKSLTAPFGGWLFQPEFAQPILARVRESRFWQLGLVRPEWLQTILDNVVPGPNKWVFQLWALVTLTSWFDTFVAGRES